MNDLNKVRFCALLHDVGKFTFRTHQRVEHNTLTEIFSQSYIKEKYSNELIGLFKPTIDDKNKNKIRKIIEISDWLASAERIKLTKEEIEEEDKKNARDVIKKPLKCIFSEIFESKIKNKKDFIYIPNSLYLKNIFPEDSNNITEEQVIKEYKNKNLWENFIEDIKKIEEDDEEKYFYKLYFLLKKHFILIPSAAWIDRSDISLFDHIKLSSAIADALFQEEINIDQYHENILNHFKNKKNKNINYDENILRKEDLIIIHGDISGIQKFIYNIYTTGALKTLKGRSAYLSLLNEVLAYHFINRLNHTVANILFYGGGHFYILSNNKNSEKVRKITDEINSLFLEQFELGLFLAVNYVGISYLDLLEGGISQKWEDVNKKTNEQKQKKFYNNFDEKFFEPKEKNIKKIIKCSVCSKEVYSENEIYYLDKEGKWQRGIFENEIKFCSFCKEMKDLFEIFKNKRWTLENIKRYFEKFNLKDYQFNFLLNDLSDFPFKFFPTILPLKEGKIMSLEEFSDNSIGLKKIAFLKIDVDNLGKIFKEGIEISEYEKNEKSIKKRNISKMSNLSTMISLFFDGYINKLIKDKYSDSIYLVYSGGDDTFAIGSWDKIISFARDVNLDFRKFTAYNPYITLSAGVYIADKKFPVAKGAICAEEYLTKAKNYESDKKNKICILNEVFDWDYLNSENDFELMLNFKDKLTEIVKKTEKSKSFLYRIRSSVLGFNKIFEDIENKKFDVPKIWRLKYYIVRNFKKENNEDIYSLLKDIDSLVIKKLNGEKVNLNIISVAARLAEFELRKEDE
ncbi:MAG: type III-A CRISPR-associated protein Cas10/Csm1 [Candidatus Woesearchaeota archaeon]